MEERLVCPGGLLLEPSRSMADFHAKQTDPPLVATQPCLIQEPVDNILAFVCASGSLPITDSQSSTLILQLVFFVKNIFLRSFEGVGIR